MFHRDGGRLLVLALFAGVLPALGYAEEKKVTRYARFQDGDVTAYGVVEGDVIHRISGTPFTKWQKTGETHALSKVKLLVPSEPKQVLAMAGNYRSHLGGEDPVTLRHTLNAEQIAWFKAGSALNVIKQQAS